MDFISSFFNWGATKEEPIDTREEPKIKNGREKTKKFKRPIQKDKVEKIIEESKEGIDLDDSNTVNSSTLSVGSTPKR
jgi:transcriptional regulator NrdR family protein